MNIISFTNQKGGVGKTTTVVNTGAGLCRLGYSVLLVDMDPQANLTHSLRIQSSRKKETIVHLLKKQLSAQDIVVRHGDLDLLPSSIELSSAEIDLIDEPSREMILKSALDVLDQQYDYVLIDCPPNLGLLTLNAFAASDTLTIVMQCEYLALHGLSRLMDLIELVQARLNEKLTLGGILCTMFDEENKLNSQIAEHIRDQYGSTVYETVIRKNSALAAAPSFHQTIFEHAPGSSGAEDYLDLAREIRSRNGA
ncbi:MAG: AAA family ATPase [Bacteroidetes bacterium]|jgi:chromosome partitioning protein|nr:AAA family ATPase [Bacteroidota bacterium]